MRTLAVLAAALVAAGCTPTTAAPPPASSAADQPTASAAPAAPPAAHGGQTVALPSADQKASGYLSLPAGAAAGKRPAVIVVQEWWGLDDWIKENADRFAAQGYVALAVDLYRGKLAKDKDAGVAHELMRGLPEDRALGDLEAGFAYLASRPDVDATRIGAVGWCMGGGYTLALAVAEPRLKAAAMNYGRLVTDPASIAKIKASLLGNFAGQDQGIPPADVRAFDAAMRGAGKDVDVKIYDPDGHAFMNPGNQKGYDKDAAKDAWSRIDGFFAKRLKGG